jgi:23S rRNA (cytidine1920-2'-O)/16S rRNA (cytidine1409-2'-O)-methyltransferase
VTRRRLDVELVRRGLAPSRAAAQEAVEAGNVRVDGVVAMKAATMVADGTAVELLDVSRPYVSRGGSKLAAALDRFAIDAAGRRCLDAGASTGGFTDVLLKRGAAHVVAVDVGYGQLAWELRTHARVTVLERTNVRALAPSDLPYRPDLLVADLSFISLRLVLPVLAAVALPNATFVLLVKPQFEAGKGEVGKRGVVREPAIWRRVLDGAIDTASGLGLAATGLMASPVPGPAGNIEFLLRLERDGGGTIDVAAAVREGEEIAR